jgi:hypothetical protein
MANEYAVVYNVGILDDIHNYFPALLYDHGQFQTVSHVLHYVRSQLHSRFNLYSYGASLHRGVAPPVPAVPVETRATDGLSLLFSILSNQMPESPRVNTRFIPTDAFLDPVIVRPTDAIINQHTTLLQGSTLPASSNCPVCQDSIIGTDVCRRLNQCRHVFHQTCIDQWFQTNVRCPTCRHDIRHVAPVATTAPPSAPAPSFHMSNI